MKVILLQNVPGLGKTDDVKDVSDGYAKNFLFPRHLAVQASAKAVQDLTAHHAKLKKDVEKELQREQALAARLEGIEVKLSEKANDKGMLYAAVTPLKIAEALEAMHFVVTKEQIKTKPLKEVGGHTVKAVLGHGLEVEFSVVISKL